MPDTAHGPQPDNREPERDAPSAEAAGTQAGPGETAPFDQEETVAMRPVGIAGEADEHAGGPEAVQDEAAGPGYSEVKPASPIGEPGMHRPPAVYSGMGNPGASRQPFVTDQARAKHGRYKEKSESDRIGMMAAGIAAIAVAVAGIVFFFAIARPIMHASQPQVHSEPQTALSQGLVMAVVSNVEFPEPEETVVDHDEPSAAWKGGSMDFYFGATSSYASGYSTPVIVKVTNYTKGSEGTTYFSMEPNVHESHDVPEGEIGIRFIGPVNQDGTMYASVDVAPRVDGDEGSATVETGRYLDSPTDDELDAAVEEIAAAVDSGGIDSSIGDLARQNREYASYYSSGYSYDYGYGDGTAYDGGSQYGTGDGTSGYGDAATGDGSQSADGYGYDDGSGSQGDASQYYDQSGANGYAY